MTYEEKRQAFINDFTECFDKEEITSLCITSLISRIRREIDYKLSFFKNIPTEELIELHPEYLKYMAAITSTADVVCQSILDYEFKPEDVFIMNKNTDVFLDMVAKLAFKNIFNQKTIKMTKKVNNYPIFALDFYINNAISWCKENNPKYHIESIDVNESGALGFKKPEDITLEDYVKNSYYFIEEPENLKTYEFFNSKNYKDYRKCIKEMYYDDEIIIDDDDYDNKSHIEEMRDETIPD